MVIIAIFAGLVLGGAGFAILKRLRQSSKSRDRELHIV
jgi:hypothetical protein